jgi:D-ribulokinase
VIVGQGMETGADSLVALYIAGLCGLGYGLRQIIETQADNGAPVETVNISGGAGAHPLTRQLLADATGLPVIVTASPEPVLLGSAMLGAVASGIFDSLPDAMHGMSRVASTCQPSSELRALHDARFTAFRRLQKDARYIRSLMAPHQIQS